MNSAWMDDYEDAYLEDDDDDFLDDNDEDYGEVYRHGVHYNGYDFQFIQE